MPRKKKTPKKTDASKETEVAISKKKTAVARKPKKASALKTLTPLDLWEAFDDAFGSFRREFENLLFPSTQALAKAWSMPETRIPVVDLEDRDKDYLLKAEMPGFKKEDIEIEVQNDSVTISGEVGWKYDKKAQAYICKERACESFYRFVELPEEIEVDEVKANLAEGVLEIALPKKTPKPKRKVKIQ